MGFKRRSWDDTSITDRALFSGLVKWKFFIHWLFARGTAGLWARLAIIFGFGNFGGGGAAGAARSPWPHARYERWLSRTSPRTSAPRRPARTSLRAIW